MRNDVVFHRDIFDEGLKVRLDYSLVRTPPYGDLIQSEIYSLLIVMTENGICIGNTFLYDISRDEKEACGFLELMCDNAVLPETALDIFKDKLSEF